MQIKRRLAAILPVAFVLGTASWAAVGLTGPADAATGISGGTWALSQPIPGLPAVSTPTDDGPVEAMTCTAPGDCVGVGYEVSGTGSAAINLPVAVTETAGTWGSPQQIGGGAGLGAGTSAELTKVSCSDEKDCTATGSYKGTDGQSHAFYATATPTGWSAATAVSEAGQPTGTFSTIGGVSCPAAGYCTIAGYYTTISGATSVPAVYAPFTLDEAHGSWGSPQPVPGLDPLPPGDISAMLLGVSCAGPGDCTAGGAYVGDFSFETQPFLVSESGSIWSSPQPVTGLSSGYVSTISCPGASDCTAAGDYLGPKGYPQAFTVDEKQGSWGSANSLASPSLAEVNGVLDLGCSSAGNCVLADTAAIHLDNGVGYVGAVTDSETTSGGWGSLAPIEPAGSGTDLPDSYPTGLSCARGGDCTIVGYYATSGGPEPYQGFAITVNGGVVGSEQPVLPATAVPPADSTLSCTQAGFCTLAYDVNGAPEVVTEATGATVTLTPSTSRVDDGSESAETLTATVSGGDGGTPTGTVEVTDGTTTVCTITLMAGEGTCSPAATAISAGTATLTATYSGDADYVAVASTATVTVDPAGTAGYTPLAPVRILDTRNGTGGFSSPVGAGKPIALQVTGQDGVPASGVTAIVLNVTATNPTASSYVTAYPDGQPRPAQGSNLNFTKGETIPNLVTVPVGADGKIDLYNNAGSVNLVADLQGYYSATGGSGLNPDGPARILDTRNGTGGFTSPVGAGKSIALPVTGQGGVPATGVTAVVLNLTANGPTANGWVVAYPDGQPRPAQGSSLNFTKGETIPNLVTVPVGADGKVDLYNSGGTVNLVADLQGYYTSTGGSALATDGPARVLDTRNGTGGFRHPDGAGKSIALPVTGRDGIPTSGVTAVVLNLTATNPTANSYVTAYPDGKARPAQGSNLNFTKGETIPNLVIVPVGSDGKIDLYNSAGSVNLVADLFGYFAG